MTDAVITPDIAHVRCVIFSKAGKKIMLLRDANSADKEQFAVKVPLKTKDGTCSDISLLIALLEQFSGHKFYALIFTKEVTIYFRDDTSAAEDLLDKKSKEKESS